MKKSITLIALVLSLALSSNVFAQKMKAAETYNNTIFVNPFALLFGIIDVGIEHKMGPENSGTANLFYWNYGSGWSGLGIGVSYRWYFNEWANSTFKLDKRTIEGLSVGPRIEVFKWTWDSGYIGTQYNGYTSVGIGAEAAYKWVFGGGWTIEPGIKFVFPIVKESYHSFDSFSGGLGLGYSF